MDVDEQLEDAFEAAWADDAGTDDGAEGAEGEHGEEPGEPGEDGMEAQGAADDEDQVLPDLEEDDQDDPDATQKGQEAGGTGEGPGAAVDTTQNLGARGPQPSTTQAAVPEAAPAPDPTAAFKKEVFDSMTEEQKNRYEAFMRSSLAKPKMKKLMQIILRNTVPAEKAVIAMCGISKLFVGELVELARVCAAQDGHQGPLLPRHIRRAYQMLGAQGKLPGRRGQTKKVFR